MPGALGRDVPKSALIRVRSCALVGGQSATKIDPFFTRVSVAIKIRKNSQANCYDSAGKIEYLASEQGECRMRLDSGGRSAIVPQLKDQLTIGVQIKRCWLKAGHPSIGYCAILIVATLPALFGML